MWFVAAESANQSYFIRATDVDIMVEREYSAMFERRRGGMFFFLKSSLRKDGVTDDTFKFFYGETHTLEGRLRST